MKYYITADIHGFYTEFHKALDEAGYFTDPEPHKLIILGDIFDRGQEAVEMQRFILSLLEQDAVILVRGNHEDLYEEMITIDEGLPVRQYEDGDFTDVFALSAQAFHKMRLETGCFPDSAPEEPSDEVRKRWAESPEERFVYVTDHEIVGYAHLDGPELDSVSIKISQQGKGFGKRFVQYLVNLILEKETGAPSLWCVAGNDKARRLYDAVGFEERFRQEFAVKTICE